MSKGTKSPSTIILIVEDEEPIVQALALILEDCGYQMLLASNGRQALELARTHQLALIITDLMMPQMTGPSSSPPSGRMPSTAIRCRPLC
jgi:CheY-like chemotaxis protein